jgi:hypothetical protein
MSSLANERVFVDGCANHFAFRMSQLFERVLIDHGIECAIQGGSNIVTQEIIETCIDQTLFDQLLKTLRGISDDGTAGREAAGTRAAA